MLQTLVLNWLWVPIQVLIVWGMGGGGRKEVVIVEGGGQNSQAMLRPTGTFQKTKHMCVILF